MGKGKTKSSAEASPQLEALDPDDPLLELEHSGDASQTKKKKAKKEKKPPPPESEDGEDVEDVEGDEAAEDEQGAQGGEGEQAARAWARAFKSANRRLPYEAELVEHAKLDPALAKAICKKLVSEANALKNKKKSRTIRGYLKLAKKAGYQVDYVKNGSAATDEGIDMVHPLVSMADVARLATHVPYVAHGPDGQQTSAVTVPVDEFNAHLELMKTSMPQRVARELTANVDPMFRYCMNAAAKAQLAMGGTKINPSTMAAVLKPMVGHLAFPTVLAPPGLVKYSKDRQPPQRKEFPSGEAGLARYKKSVAAFNKKVGYVDRGLGFVEVDAADEGEDKLKKLNNKEKAANLSAFAKETAKRKRDADEVEAAEGA